MKFPPSTPVVWFGVLGGGIAWLTQFVINLAFSFAQCEAPPGRWQLPVRGYEIAVSAAGIAVGLLSTMVAMWLYLRTYRLEDIAQAERRGKGSAPPVGRLNFLAVVGLTVNFLALSIMILSGIGAPLLRLCQQS